jgi:hypothetical protein
MNKSDPNYKQFKAEFWEWFDSLPLSKKKAFWNYRDDAAEMNFYFTVWEKRDDKNQIRQK